MWFPDRRCWRVGLAARQLVLARGGGGWPRKPVACETLACAPVADEPLWRPAVDALARLLASEQAVAPGLQIVLSGQFVRWQLLEWRAELRGEQELAAYAGLRFSETFGPLAADWVVQHAPQPPGRAVPACAVDAALVQALRDVCKGSGTRLVAVTPYFASAAEHWRHRMRGKAAWFGLVEADFVSLGLLGKTGWLGLHAERVEGDWRAALPGLMARMGIAAGTAESAAPVYLAGTGAPPAHEASPDFEWLHAPAVPAANSACRLALGV